MELIQGDCLEEMAKLPDGCVDLTVTSPPYDNLRTYNGSIDWGEHVWKPCLEQLYRITAKGGVVVWVVGDATIKGSETGTSFRQALYAKEIGFNLHDTMIWNKPNAMPQVDKSRFCQSFEYMFVFSKGKPCTSTPVKIPTKNAGKTIIRKSRNQENCNKPLRIDETKKDRISFNVYNCNVGCRSFGHPAIFPEALANVHIMSWSNEGDTVLDPFMGSGTTGKMAKSLNRNFIGIEKDPEYFKIAEERIGET
jgi:site-specific DNA-methyltransferase (adenine-specific)